MSRLMLRIGKGSCVNADKVLFIVDADADKVRRILNRYGLNRSSKTVFDATSENETRSLLMLDDGSMAISSISGSVLAKNFQSKVRPKDL